MAVFLAAEISTVICDKPEKAKILLDHVERRETPGLSSIILMDPFENELAERGKRCGVRIQTMQEVEVSLVSFSFYFFFFVISVKRQYIVQRLVNCVPGSVSGEHKRAACA